MTDHRDRLYVIFRGATIIGHSALESGDPPMGVATGVFEPTARFLQIRDSWRPVVDGAGHRHPDMRAWDGLSVRTPDGIEVECQGGVEVVEAGPADAPWGREVTCFCIPYPMYEQLFPAHVEAYRNAFR
jgi:hypothetical protein